MVISFTTCVVPTDEIEEFSDFLGAWLARLKEADGVYEAYYFTQLGGGNDRTLATIIIVWYDQEAQLSHWNSELLEEAVAFAKQRGLKMTRESYPLTFPG